MSDELEIKTHAGPAELKEGESAKDIVVRTIQPAIAREVMKAGHYSHKVVANSCLHFGIYWGGKLEGVLQYGHSIDKRKMLGLVEGTTWDGFLELNRMWMSPVLPKNAESRALAITLKMIRKNLPQIKWVVSYADGTQAGSGTIYRASGFILTGIRENQTIVYIPAMRECFAKITFTTNKSIRVYERIRNATGVDVMAAMRGSASMEKVIEALNGKVLKGYQVRYIYFVDPTWRPRLKVKEIPFEELKKLEWPEGIK